MHRKSNNLQIRSERKWIFRDILADKRERERLGRLNDGCAGIASDNEKENDGTYLLVDLVERTWCQSPFLPSFHHSRFSITITLPTQR